MTRKSFLTYIQLNTLQRNDTVYTLLKWLNFSVFCKYTPILNVMSAIRFKKAGSGAAKDWESRGMFKSRMCGTFHR